MKAVGKAPPTDVEEIVWRHGWNATAVQTLDPGYAYFTRGDGCVAYVEARKKAWVAAGAPITREDRLCEVADAFVEAARAAGRRCCFFATEERFVQRAEGKLESLVIGQQPVWDPSRWDDKLRSSKSLREQLRRSRAKGLRVHQPMDGERQGRLSAVDDLAARWLATKGMAPMGFLVRIFPAAPHRRCFVAVRWGKVVGFALVVPVPGREGWFLENLVRDPSAPNGTTELLVDAVMRWAAGGGSRWLTMGLAPLAGDVGRGLAAIRRHAAALYDFEGLRNFKAKLRPDAWHPISLSYPVGQGAWVSVMDALGAFAEGGLLAFGLRSLFRGGSSARRAVSWALREQI